MECLKLTYLPNREMYVPCGKCAFCAATRRSDWSLRLRYEGKLHFGSKFITLTYADCHLSFRSGVSQLVKSDLQKFFKRLRKSAAGVPLRYYAVGEYGSKTHRPHYHIILFGDVPEKQIRDAWPFGQVHIGSVTPASVAYCLGYIVNRRARTGRRARVAEFAVMSRGDRKEGSKFRYGLGHNYLTKAMVEWHRSGRKNYVIVDGGKRHLPRYYKDRIFSKIDLVRIAVRSDKEQFKRMVNWIRHPLRRAMRDPLAYYEELRRLAAQRIRFKSKENLTI